MVLAFTEQEEVSQKLSVFSYEYKFLDTVLLSNLPGLH